MKRSEINAALTRSIALCERHNFHLPPWAQWAPDDWLRAGHEYDEVRDCGLGWDVTDFGSGRFADVGLSVFTIRNGHPTLAAYAKPYCEKLLIVEEDQYTPYHFHWAKMEDIICRSGGNLMVTVYNASPADGLDDSAVLVNTDGHRCEVGAGATIRLTPGESITLPFSRLPHLLGRGRPWHGARWRGLEGQ